MDDRANWKRVTIRLTIGERTADLLWSALTNLEHDLPDDATASDHAAYQRLMSNVSRQLREQR